MKVLLDTNALIWLLGDIDGASLGAKAKQLIENADEVYASSVNILEIRIKTMLGKLQSEDSLAEDISAAGLKSLSFDIKHADALTLFPTLRKHDPFDRMLIAQSQVESMVLITSDNVLLKLSNTQTADSRK
ncbi:MAG TPA: type II toxin-antitoxin system VapC family toxin [Candidatus Dormibacteraeota bacterium]|nr:type II toxin-antitoxin system VapC family toxin [Candidatus Dormibacteraeota bacterium]